ncbi:hypothetical protein IPV09_05985 [Tessaracoccus sp. SD287]|uniref:hypothetical protein n=1 Tax=Tessaracoccus sp. SD287 TaxID=2782008 RepID=UPI001A97A32C|nr:hypothetical protein [Tessaracoccus sp. SD287]MBO1030882.1 hypothetical protein [Tessaracoccus sp. SD287]
MIINTVTSAEARDVVAPRLAVAGSVRVRARGANDGLGNGTTVEFSTSQDNSTDSPPDRHSC